MNESSEELAMGVLMNMEEGNSVKRKVMVVIENSYGKGDGDEVTDTFVAADSKELREGLVEEWFWSRSDIYDDIEGFINGIQDSLYGDLVGGDWDDPTGRYVFITTKEDALREVKSKYYEELARIEKLYRESN